MSKTATYSDVAWITKATGATYRGSTR
jgi:hypothetical protein